MRDMRESGVTWIGEIPTDWSLIRFKDKYTNIKEVAKERSVEFERLALTLNGVIKRPKDDSEGLQPKEFDGYQILRENDFVFKMIDLQNISTSRVGLSPYTGLVSPAYIRFSPKEPNQYNQFVYYYLMSMYYNCVYNNLGGNGVRSALNGRDMGEFVIPYPSESEQREISAFLDKKCNQVNALIENVQAQIEKLKAYKQSLITEVVTKGLDPTVPMKDSGVEWISEIPEHWEITRIKNMFELRNERNNEADLSKVNLISLYTDLGVVQHSDITETTGNRAVTAEGYKFVHKDDIVVNIILCWMGAIGMSKYDGVTSPAYDIYRPLEGTNSEYYHYLFRTNRFNGECYRYGRGIMMMRWRTYSTEFRAINIPCPPASEQKQIVEYLNEKCAQIDRLIAIKQSKIEKLEQYKKSLIYEYVTGKKEMS